MKPFVDIFVELADDKDKSDAKRIAKVLEKNGIDSIRKLIESNDNEIMYIKGIGTRAMNVISVIKTREMFKAEKKMNSYKKLKGKKRVPIDIKSCMIDLGCTTMNAAQFEHILKRGGIVTIDDLLNTSQEDLSQIKGIGPKRLQMCVQLKGMISARK